MKISDETLSSFLDGELTDREMEIVRDALMDDGCIADRLAELAKVTAMVAATLRVH